MQVMTSDIRQQRDQERRDRTRARLLEAALAVFAERGYHNTLVSDIVREAEVGQGTFYRNFTDKRDIFNTLMEDFIDKIFDEFSDMSANLPRNFRMYYESSMDALIKMADVLEGHRDITLLFLREASGIDKEFEQAMSMIHDRFAGLAQFYLDHAIANGFARPCRSDVVSQSLVAIGLRQIHKHLSNPAPQLSKEEMIHEVLDFAFFGFGQPDDSFKR
jgi:AcrR family transcriptional regulator